MVCSPCWEHTIVQTLSGLFLYMCVLIYYKISGRLFMRWDLIHTIYPLTKYNVLHLLSFR